MKTYRLLVVVMAALLLGFGSQAYAATPREDLVQAYVLLKTANNDYAGHRGKAVRELEAAAHDLGMDIRSSGAERQGQMTSDAKVAEAGRILKDVRYRLDKRDRDLAAGHVDRAIHQIDDALKVK